MEFTDEQKITIQSAHTSGYNGYKYQIATKQIDGGDTQWHVTAKPEWNWTTNTYRIYIPVDNPPNITDMDVVCIYAYLYRLYFLEPITGQESNLSKYTLVTRDNITYRLKIISVTVFMDDRIETTQVNCAQLQVDISAEIANDLSVGDELDVNGLATLSSLKVNNNSNFIKDVSISGKATIDSEEVLNDELVDGDLTVTGDSILNNSLKVNGHTKLNTLELEHISVGDYINVTDLTASNNIQTKTLESTDHAKLNSLEVTVDESVGGDVTIAGDTSIGKNETLAGTLTVGGVSTLNSQLNVNDKAVITGDTSVGGNLTVTGDLKIQGKTTLVNETAYTRIRVDAPAEITLASALEDSFLIGQGSGLNIGMDSNEIQARNSTNKSTLYLNPQGGEVNVNETLRVEGLERVESEDNTHGIRFTGTDDTLNLNAKDESLLSLGMKSFRFSDSSDWDKNKWAGLNYESDSSTVNLGIADGTTFGASSASNSNGELHTPGVGAVVSSKLILNGGTGKYADNYNQGIRINRNTNLSWASVILGGEADSTSGTDENVWLIGKPSNSNDLIINRNGDINSKESRFFGGSDSGVGLSVPGGVNIGPLEMRYNNLTKSVEFSFEQ